MDEDVFSWADERYRLQTALTVSRKWSARWKAMTRHIWRNLVRLVETTYPLGLKLRDEREQAEADRDRLAAELAACRRVLAHLDPVLLDSLSIALAEEGDNNHALQLTAAARELRALDKED